MCVCERERECAAVTILDLGVSATVSRCTAAVSVSYARITLPSSSSTLFPRPCPSLPLSLSLPLPPSFLASLPHLLTRSLPPSLPPSLDPSLPDTHTYAECNEYGGEGGQDAIGRGGRANDQVSVARCRLMVDAPAQERAGDTLGTNERVVLKAFVPSPTLSPTDPVPRGLLTLCPGVY